jgi:hypothetical protein
MDPTENNNPSTPFRDLSNTTNPEAHAKRRKAELQKARRAAMSEDKKNEINRKRREARQGKKAQSTHPQSSTGDIAKKKAFIACITHISYMVMEQFVGGQAASNKENEDPNGNDDWLHRNNSYQPHYVGVENVSIHVPGVVCILCIMLSIIMK